MPGTDILPSLKVLLHRCVYRRNAMVHPSTSECQPAGLVRMLDQEVEPDLAGDVRHLDAPVPSAAVLGVTAPEKGTSSLKSFDPGQMIAGQLDTHAVLLS